MSRADRIAGRLGAVLLLAVLVPMGLMLWSLLDQGGGLISPAFLLEDPRQAGRAGGIASLLVSTGGILMVCLVLAVPVGLGCALYLSEQVPAGYRRARWLGGVLDMLAAVPSQCPDDFPADMLFKKRERRKDVIRSFTLPEGLATAVEALVATDGVDVRTSCYCRTIES